MKFSDGSIGKRQNHHGIARRNSILHSEICLLRNGKMHRKAEEIS